MLTVRHGPFQPALERAFLEDLAQLRREDPAGAVAVVAPSRRMLDRLQRLAALEGGLSLLGVRFTTFHGLALDIVREGGGLDRVLLRDAAFFDKLIDGLIADDDRPRGLASAYRASLKDLVDSGVEPRARELLAEGLLPEGPESRRLKSLLDLLERYEKRLAALGVAPPSELVRRAAALAAGSPALKGLKRVLYYGFYDLTGLQADFFAAVADCADTTLYYPYAKGHPAYAFAERFFKTKLHQGGRTPEALAPAHSGRALGDCLEALFSPGRTGTLPAGALKIFNASGARDELWRVAKEILRLIEVEGARPSDIGVVARALEPYRSAVREAFEESCVPYHMNAAEPLLRAPAAKAAASLLSLGRRDFPALTVLDLAASPYFRGKAGPHWRALVERLRIHRGWLQWEGKLSPVLRADFELFPQLKAEGRHGLAVSREESKALWTLLTRWKEKLAPSGKRSWSEWAAYAAGFLRAELDADGEAAFEEALLRLGSLSVFDRLGAAVDFDEFVRAAEDCLEGASRALPERANLGVRVLDAMEARGDSFKYLFLVGMREGLFPRTVREDPLLRDQSRRALRETGGYWISDKQAGYDEEKLLFHLLAASAETRLYLSYPRSNEEGRLQVPSIYLLDLCRAAGISFGDSAWSEHLPRQPEAKLAQPHLAAYLSPKEASLGSALSGGDTAAVLRAFKWGADGYEKLLRRVRELNRGGKPGIIDGVIGPPAEFLAELRLRGLSPSALESLNRCAFQFFASRVLRLDEPREPSEAGEISPQVKGEIYHAVLNGFYARLNKDDWWGKGAPGFPQAALEGAAAEVFARYGWREMGVYPLLWEIARDAMAQTLSRFAQIDTEELKASGLRPLLLEEELEGGVDAPLPESLSGLRFSGRADRIDAGAGRYRVVDYKSKSRNESLASLVGKGKSMQPPIYLELSAQHPKLKGLKAEGVRLYALEDSAGDGALAFEDYAASGHSENRGERRALLGALIDSIARGSFPIKPNDGPHGHCKFCSFGDFCRKNHSATLWRSREEA